MSFVYILSNESMPGIVKVGKANDPDRRLKELSSDTGVVTPFVSEHVVYVGDRAYEVEQDAHRILQKVRVNPNREFFKASPHDALTAVYEAFLADEEMSNAKELKENSIAEAHRHLAGEIDYDERPRRGAREYLADNTGNSRLGRHEYTKRRERASTFEEKVLVERWWTGQPISDCSAAIEAEIHKEAERKKAEALEFQAIELEFKSEERLEALRSEIYERARPLKIASGVLVVLGLFALILGVFVDEPPFLAEAWGGYCLGVSILSFFVSGVVKLYTPNLEETLERERTADERKKERIRMRKAKLDWEEHG